MDPPLTKDKGRVKFNGHYEISYSQKNLPGKTKHITDRIIDKRGIYMDLQGYIYVATTLVPMGGKINTSLGMGRRHETTQLINTVEIYTNW